MAQVLDLQTASTKMLNWSHGAVYCHDTRQDCRNCSNFQVVGNQCKMPDIVRGLLRSRLPMPAETPRRIANAERSIKPENNPWLRGLDVSFLPVAW